MSLEKIVADNTDAINRLATGFEQLIELYQSGTIVAPQSTQAANDSKAGADLKTVDKPKPAKAAEAKPETVKTADLDPDDPYGLGDDSPAPVDTDDKPVEAKPVKKPRAKKAAAKKAAEPAELTLEYVQQKWVKLAEPRKAKAMVILARHFDCKKVSDVPEDKWPELLELIAEAMPNA